MSRIKYYSKGTNAVYFGLYRQILAYYIGKVLKAIGENDDGITWYICIEDDLPDNPKTKWAKETQRLTGLVVDAQYGRSNVQSKEIWISTYAIQFAPYPDFEKIGFFIGYRKNNRLVEVIIDEYTHIKTKKNHGDSEYDQLKNYYLQRYYLGERVFLRNIR